MVLEDSEEVERIRELKEYRIMDTPPDPNLDRITHLAATLCNTPMALISLVDDHRQWFKSSYGVEIKETPRCDAFCLEVIQGRDFFIIEDASASELFAHNPLVSGLFGLRFYAGAPLVNERGFILGTLCVLDKVPRRLDDNQIKGLNLLADEVMVHMELHRQRMLNQIQRQDQLKSEQELQMLSRAISMRNACSEALIRSKDEEDLLTSICDIAVNIGGYAMVWVGYAQNDEEKLVKPVAFSGTASDIGFLKDRVISWSPDSEFGNGPGGFTIRESRAIHIKNLATSSMFAPWLSAAQKRGFQDLITIPLRHEQSSMGFFALYRREPRDVSADELQLLQKLADDMVFGIMTRRTAKERERIYGAVMKIAEAVSITDLEAFFQQIISNMVDAINATGGFGALMAFDCASIRLVSRFDHGREVPQKTYRLPAPLQEQLCRLKDNGMEEIAKLMQAFVQEKLSLENYSLKMLGEKADDQYVFVGAFFQPPHEFSEFIHSTMQIFAFKSIAELKRLHADRRIHEQAALLDKAQDAIIVVGLNQQILFWNQGATRLYGWTKEEALGQSNRILFTEQSAQVHAHAQQILMSTGDWSGEVELRHKSGQHITIETHCTLVRNDQGEPVSVLSIDNDITQRKKAEREIHRLAFYDTLTNLPNRQLLVERLQQVLSIELRHHSKGALLFIDLDNFKMLNDTLGHDMGDMLLQKVASRLSACVRESDTVARFGGDEFVVLLVDLSHDNDEAMDQAQSIGEIILEKLNRPYYFAGKEHHSTPSIGITLFGGSHDSVEELLKQADLAMYQAKARGRNGICFFDPKMQSAVSYHAKIEADIRIGLRKHQFVFHYQPQLTHEGTVIGAEALARWKHPTHGLIQPKDFIPFAETSGLIFPLSHQLFETACRQIAEWSQDPVTARLVIALNISSKQLRQPEFVSTLKEILLKYETDPTKLKLEITESLLVENIEDTIVKMNELRELGISFSLDDFGTGYSSLAYLKRLPLDQLKIDQSFIKEAAVNDNDAAIARTILALGENLGLDVIAEGVETMEQRQFLEASNCRLYQGYLFSEAVPADQFEEFIKQTVH